MPAAGLTRMHAMASIPPTRPPRPLLDAFRVNPLTLLLIAAINTGIALVLWIDDTRPFWQPLLTVQLYGFSIAYCVNVAKPWDHEKPLRRLVAAALIGSLIGVVLVIVVKGYSPTYVRERAAFFLYNVFAAFGNGLLDQPHLLRQAPRGARRDCAAQGGGGTPPAVEAGDRSGAEVACRRRSSRISCSTRLRPCST